MTCICMKTGFIAYSTEYGCYLRGDSHKIGDMMVFRVSQTDMNVVPETHVNYEIHQIEQWWKDKPYSTLIAHSFYITDHGYDGKPVSELKLPPF